MAIVKHLNHVDPHKHAFRIFCAVLKSQTLLKSGDAEVDKAHTMNVTLIGYVKPFGDDSKCDITWLNKYSGTYYSHIRDAHKIDILIGHYPLTHTAAFNFKRTLYNKAHIILFIHKLDDQCMNNLTENRVDIVILLNNSMLEQYQKLSDGQPPLKYHLLVLHQWNPQEGYWGEKCLTICHRRTEPTVSETKTALARKILGKH